ncbi:hypothetical protein P691DRAFT_766726 [Macrolepiota fuliginosa MF-IS2]|uniref:Uncharacterized protein n=1 Tax=Macrolepiota fuliginosa MF-IS2 TaxID=1400762 RepID=A0A9P5X0H0_9AGAR|nr:hypothetical protein P691DRAFT_766726 [Macrolepiota fuliginosa MF-IS2]
MFPFQEMASYLLADIKPLTGSENYCDWSFDMLQALNLTMHEGMNAGLVTLGTLPCPAELLEHWVADPNWEPADHPAGAVPTQVCINAAEVTLRNCEQIAWSTINTMAQGMINSKLACQHKRHGLDSALILWTHLEATFGTYGAMNACNMWQQIVATCFSGHHACISSELAQLNNLIDKFSAQEIIPASIRTILMLCVMLKSWEETQNTLLHTHHNNLAQLTPDVIGQACWIAATSRSFSITHEASAAPAKQLGIQKGGSAPKWNKQGDQNSQQQQGQQPKLQQPSADSKAPSGDKEDSAPRKRGCRGGKNQKKPNGARGNANQATSGDTFIQPPGSGMAPIPLLAITGAFAIATPATITTTCSLIDRINVEKEAVPPLASWVAPRAPDGHLVGKTHYQKAKGRALVHQSKRLSESQFNGNWDNVKEDNNPFADDFWQRTKPYLHTPTPCPPSPCVAPMDVDDSVSVGTPGTPASWYDDNDFSIDPTILTDLYGPQGSASPIAP